MVNRGSGGGFARVSQKWKFPTRRNHRILGSYQSLRVDPKRAESLMGENGVNFSDGMERDLLEFNSGTKATIAIAERRGRLVV